MATDDPHPEEVEQQIALAREALADAEGALEADLSESVIVNRLYYACFHAAQAVLYDRGIVPNSHGAVLSLFGSEVVLAGDASREQGRFLNRLSDLRKRADYEYAPIDEDLDELISDTRSFVSDMDALVSQG